MKWSVLALSHVLFALSSLISWKTLGIFFQYSNDQQKLLDVLWNGQPEKWILFDLKMLILYVWNTIGCSVSTNVGKLESFRFTWSRCICWEGFPYEEPLKWGELDKVPKNCSDQYYSVHNLSSMFGIFYSFGLSDSCSLWTLKLSFWFTFISKLSCKVVGSQDTSI